MDYRTHGIYSEGKSSLDNGRLLITDNDKKYEIEEFIIGEKLVIDGNILYYDDKIINLKKRCIKALLSDNFIFVCYEMKLCIYNKECRLIKEIESEEKIFLGTYGFLIYDKTHFIVNLKGECVFVSKGRNILNFTEDGVLFCIEDDAKNDSLACVESNASVDSKFNKEDDNHLNTGSISQKNGGELNNISINSAKCHDGFFTIQTIKKKKIFYIDGELIQEFQDYKVYKDTAKIDNVLSCSSIKIEISSDEFRAIASSMYISTSPSKLNLVDFIIVTCSDCLFIIFDDFIIKQKVEHPFPRIISERLCVHNYVEELDVYNALIFLNCFITTRLHKSNNIENFLTAAINCNLEKKLLEKFLKSLKWNSEVSNDFDFGKILCRAYRQVDDKAKEYLNSWINSLTLNAEQLYFIIIYRPDLTENFIDLCKNEKKLFFLLDLKEFYQKTNRAEELKVLFLKKGLLIFDYPEVEKFCEIERQQIESQRRTYVAKINNL